MASTAIMSGSRATTVRNKKRKKMNPRDQTQTEQNDAVPWKSEVQQQVYSSKLLHALNHLRIDAPPSIPTRGRAVREAADRVLAIAAKGRTRWSRAILTNRLKLKFMKKSANKRIQRASNIGTGNRGVQKRGKMGILRLKAKNLPAVQRKVKVLGKLVPGCRKQSMPVVLEEAGDYIAALEMQVRAMSALADLLSGSASSSQLGSSEPNV